MIKKVLESFYWPLMRNDFSSSTINYDQFHDNEEWQKMLSAENINFPIASSKRIKQKKIRKAISCGKCH